MPGLNFLKKLFLGTLGTLAFVTIGIVLSINNDSQSAADVSGVVDRYDDTSWTDGGDMSGPGCGNCKAYMGLYRNDCPFSGWPVGYPASWASISAYFCDPYYTRADTAWRPHCGIDIATLHQTDENNNITPYDGITGEYEFREGGTPVSGIFNAPIYQTTDYAYVYKAVTNGEPNRCKGNFVAVEALDKVDESNLLREDTCEDGIVPGDEANDENHWSNEYDGALVNINRFGYMTAFSAVSVLPSWFQQDDGGDEGEDDGDSCGVGGDGCNEDDGGTDAESEGEENEESPCDEPGVDCAALRSNDYNNPDAKVLPKVCRAIDINGDGMTDVYEFPDPTKAKYTGEYVYIEGEAAWFEYTAWKAWYYHLVRHNEEVVFEGKFLRRGDADLGYVDNTPNASCTTGNHLHYQIEPPDAPMYDPGFTLVGEKEDIPPYSSVFLQYLWGGGYRVNLATCLEPERAEELNWGTKCGDEALLSQLENQPPQEEE